MKKKTINTFMLSVALSLSVSLISFAGTWQSVDDKWKYQNDDGSYVTDEWLSENGASYYFDSNGNMLVNTLSPDGRALGKDGKLVSNNEVFPAVFPGNEADYTAYFDTLFDFIDGPDADFNQTYDDVYLKVLNAYDTGEYITATEQIERLNAFDFTPYTNSPYMGIRKLAAINEIFRIEQFYFLSELVHAYQQQDYAYMIVLYDSMSASISKYADEFSAVLDQTARWDIY